MSRFLLGVGDDVTLRDMKKAFRNLIFAALAAACTAFSSAPRDLGCSDAVLRQYAEVVATASLNEAQTSDGYGRLPGGAERPPSTTLISTDDVAFCRDKPRAVLCAGNGNRRALSLAQVNAIDQRLRTEFHYVSDTVLYGRADRWVNDRTCGDCEDYALLLSERLSAAGQPGGDMALMLWAPTPTTAHATLIVNTSDGQFEFGVGSREWAMPMDWTRGRRAAFMTADGARSWTLLAR